MERGSLGHDCMLSTPAAVRGSATAWGAEAGTACASSAPHACTQACTTAPSLKHRARHLHPRPIRTHHPHATAVKGLIPAQQHGPGGQRLRQWGQALLLPLLPLLPLLAVPPALLQVQLLLPLLLVQLALPLLPLQEGLVSGIEQG